MKSALIIGNGTSAYQYPALVIGVASNEAALTLLKDTLNFSFGGTQSGAQFNGTAIIGGDAGGLTQWVNSEGQLVQVMVVRVEETVQVGDFLSPSSDVYHKYV